MSSTSLMAAGQFPTLCTDKSCPSDLSHNAGYYNLTAYATWRETHLTNKLPRDIEDLLDACMASLIPQSYEQPLEDWVILAKFAVVHHSHLTGLMPAEITKTKFWKHSEVQKILKSEQPRPRVLPSSKLAQDVDVKPSGCQPVTKSKPVKKTGRIGMGRGVPTTGIFNPAAMAKMAKA